MLGPYRNLTLISTNWYPTAPPSHAKSISEREQNQGIEVMTTVKYSLVTFSKLVMIAIVLRRLMLSF